MDEIKRCLINLLILFLAASCLGKCTSDNKHLKEKIAQETKQEQQETSQTSEDNTGDMKAYMREIQRRVKTNWDLPDNVLAERGYNNVKVAVKFTVSKDGRLVGKPEIVQSSGLDIADKKCLEAVEISAPFRPLPTFIKKDSVDIEFTFEAGKR